MITELINIIKDRRFARSQAYLIDEQGTLMNAFSNSNSIFIHIPKTAGRSIISAIYGDVIGGGHRKYSFYKYIIGKEIANYFKFSFVRNPYDRLYSSYKFLENGGLNIHDQNAFDQFLSMYESFEDFVINGLNNRIIRDVVHFIPQTDFICDKQGRILVDYIGKFECLDLHFKSVCLRLNKKNILPHLNLNKKDSFDKVYTEKMKEIVRSFYEKDFKILGY